MSWETDQPPLNYLKRRIKYYKKKRGEVRGFIKSEFFIQQYGGKRKLKKLIAKRIYQIEDRIKEYEIAIKYIENGIRRNKKNEGTSKATKAKEGVPDTQEEQEEIRAGESGEG